MEIVVLYLGKERKEEEQMYKGLIIMEILNMEQEIFLDFNLVVDLSVIELDLLNVFVIKFEYLDSEVVLSVFIELEKIQEMEIDLSS